MARKKPSRRGGHPRRPSRPQPPPDLPPLRDPRVLERSLQELVGDGGNPALARAQECMYRAFAEADPRRRAGLAREALALCPDCADAYVLLAEQAPRRKEALALYEQGAAAGERALGEQTFRDEAGRFWGLLHTRPYMRARLGLAHALWTAGRRGEAVGHARELLRLNPGDNQGVRYTLAAWLLALDRDDELAGLLEQFPDEATAAWAYNRALLAFRRHGDTPEARRLLQEALQSNQHVPAYLLGEKFPPAEHPPFYTRGDESEALVYIGGAIAGWRATPGAVAWLRRAVTKKKDAPRPRGPLGFVKAWLNRHLPQEPDVWQADSRPLPTWLVSGGVRVRPWLTLVVSGSHDLVLAHAVHEEPPSPGHVWDAFVEAMQHPMVGEPHRPTELEVPAGEPWESLREHLEEVGVRVAAGEVGQPLKDIFPGLAEHLAGPRPPGLLDGPGVRPELAGRFYDAAAYYFEEAPWRKVGYEAAIRVECDGIPGGPWYAVIMGQSGLTLGLAVYHDLGLLRRMWSEDEGDEVEDSDRRAGLGVIYGEEADVPVADLDAARAHDWRVAREDAYPSAFRKEREASARSLRARELALLEACLRAVPGFVARHRQDDPAREEVAVPAGAGEVRLALSWVTDDD
jgi:tetratricopeptide (TPR) repeat protein